MIDGDSTGGKTNVVIDFDILSNGRGGIEARLNTLQAKNRCGCLFRVRMGSFPDCPRYLAAFI